MIDWRFDPNFPLELLNGAGAIVEIFFIVFLVHYIWREMRRRELGLSAIPFGFPPSMNLAIAVLAFDCGVFIRTVVIWSWRRFFDAGDFGLIQITLLGIGSLIILIGGLCKIRAVSLPDRGHGPWLTAAAAIAVFVFVTIISR